MVRFFERSGEDEDEKRDLSIHGRYELGYSIIQWYEVVKVKMKVRVMLD